MKTSRKTIRTFRKAHRYLGVFLGLQFLMWTISGIYFSWTDIDEIHGDHFRIGDPVSTSFENLIHPLSDTHLEGISSLELRDIGGKPYYWINDSYLMDARSGLKRTGITEEEALQIAGANMSPELKVKAIERIQEVGPHDEYREKPLPAYVISYDSPKEVKAYISIEDGAFQTVRYRDWRWFDFLWMTHTMDYQGRDDFNTILLRGFSLMGLITVLSGFILFYLSSPTMGKIRLKI
ncbi:hypothetical protein SAMN06265375_102147 [Muriicola jejuensis]|uniref:PepSY domain-containing protein n=1 Tax=Muriicola jejuensis TaxID=504488 RepID=A0A6P0UC61_9FLAO|nr:PepSY domain-containing protein [Muriicola jejuensis]NER10871.1 hypothetical protein [Muriicola jejuensis]SMP15895.1 hypothetical protein SAMN06265375_102147 [Muriicola jejuensis]